MNKPCKKCGSLGDIHGNPCECSKDNSPLNYPKDSEDTFTLSDEMFVCPSDGSNSYEEKDVKEFLKRVKDELYEDFGTEDGGSYGVIKGTIDKLAGKGLL